MPATGMAVSKQDCKLRFISFLVAVACAVLAFGYWDWGRLITGGLDLIESPSLSLPLLFMLLKLSFRSTATPPVCGREAIESWSDVVPDGKQSLSSDSWRIFNSLKLKKIVIPIFFLLLSRKTIWSGIIWDVTHTVESWVLTRVTN